jgi:hypothetical protein
MVKDAIVVHPRRADWSHEVSSVLNVGLLRVGALNMVSTGSGPLSLQTPAMCDLILSDKVR